MDMIPESVRVRLSYKMSSRNREPLILRFDKTWKEILEKSDLCPSIRFVGRCASPKSLGQTINK
jgi:hypothetical protein